MLTLVLVVLVLAAAQLFCARAVRQGDDRLMRPADDLSPEDIDRWLDLIVTFDLPSNPKRVP